jgi:hypothetical protein
LFVSISWIPLVFRDFENDGGALSFASSTMGGNILHRHVKEGLVHVFVAVILGVLAWIHEARMIEPSPRKPLTLESLVEVIHHRDAFQLMVLLWILQGAVVGCWALIMLRDEFDGVSKLARAVTALEERLGTDRHLYGYPSVIQSAFEDASMQALVGFKPREFEIHDFMYSGLWYREFWEKLAKAQERLREKGKGLIVRITQNASAAGSTFGPWSGQAGDSLVEIQAEMVRNGARILRIFVGRTADPEARNALAALCQKMNNAGVHALKYEDDDQKPRGDFLWLALDGVDEPTLGREDLVVKWFYSGNHVESSRVSMGAAQAIKGMWRRLAADVSKQADIAPEVRDLLLSQDSYVPLSKKK